MSVLKGGERTLHRWSIISRQAGVWLLALLIGAGLGWGVGMKLDSNPAEWQAAHSVLLSMGAERKRALHSREWRGFKANSRRAGQLGSAGGAGALFLLWWLFDKFGQVGDKKHKRGSRLATAAQVSKMIRKRGQPDLELCGVPLPEGSERTHILLVGTSGVGKSTVMRQGLDQIREKDERALVYDPGGHFLSEYAREGDILLNPFDHRSDNWSIFHEIQSERDAVRVAQSLVTGKEGKDEGFVQGGRSVLSSLIWKLSKSGQTSMSQFYEWLVMSDQEQLAEYLAGTPGARPLGKGAAEQASGMLSFAAENAAAIQAYAQASHLSGEQPFSIRRWVREGEAGSIVWMPIQKAHAAEVLPLISLWMDLAASELMSLGESKERRLWFFADELATLNKMEALPTLLAEGRKYGAAAVLGFQNLAQLRLKYGKDGATALLDLLNTKLIFRSGDPEIAEYGSKILGEAEVERKNEGESLGRGGRDGSSLNQQITREPLVMPSQLMNLKKFHAYLVLPDDLPHCIVQTSKRNDVAKIPAFTEA